MATTLRRRAERLIAGEEEARRRIGRDLHDDHCQRLAALALELKALRKGLVDGDARRTEMDALSASLAELGEDLRQLSHDLHPAILERRGLAEALRDHCEDIERRHGLRVRLTLGDPPGFLPPLLPEISLALYRIVQESLANVVRHAGANEARVKVWTAGGGVRLTVADDGAGFDPGDARRRGGLGLVNIEERAGLLDGQCRIVSAPGAGTEIEIRIPLPSEGGVLAQLGVLARRHRGLVVAVALVILALGAGLVATVFQARRAQLEAARADASARFLEELFEASDPRQARGNPPSGRDLLRHGTERLAKELHDQPALRARLLDTLGGIHSGLGLYDEARPLLEEALELRESLHGDHSLEVAATLGRLGALAQLSGKGDAVALFERALAIREARRGADHPELAEGLHDLGTALAAKSRFEESEAVLRRTLELQQRHWGARDPRVAKTLHNLAGIAFYGGRLEESEGLLKRALEIREATLPADDLDLAGSREALALLLTQQGRAAEAAELLEQLVTSAEAVYGPDHQAFARATLNLGLARSTLGQDEAAQRDLERALAILERGLAADHPVVVRALASLAGHQLRQGRHAAAEPLYRRLLALRERGATYEGWDQVMAEWQQLASSTDRAKEASASP